MLIDIGVNLSNSQYKNDVEDVLMRAQEAGVRKDGPHRNIYRRK